MNSGIIYIPFTNINGWNVRAAAVDHSKFYDTTVYSYRLDITIEYRGAFYNGNHVFRTREAAWAWIADKYSKEAREQEIDLEKHLTRVEGNRYVIAEEAI